MSYKTAVIIGAGVTGLSAACHLAQRQYGKIIILDKGPVGDGSSSRAAGIITGLLWSETGVKARNISLELFRELSAKLKGYTFQSVGALNLFTPGGWKEREKLLAIYDACGARYEVLDSQEMRRRWPSLHPKDEWKGLYDPRGGYSEPDEYIPALAAECRRLGVDIREGEMVKDFILKGNQVCGVKTASTSIEADAVVSTVYSWTNVLLSRLGIQLPVKTVVHQRYITDKLPHEITIPVVNADPLYGYFRPASGGKLLFGIETTDRKEEKVTDPYYHLSSLDNSDPSYTADVLQQKIRENFSDYMPLLKDLKWTASKTGLLTFSMDGEPILGPIGEFPGLYVGVAFHSGGFAYNPVSGLLLSQFVADGKTSLDVSAFSPGRFNRKETDEYLSQTVQQKNVARRRH